MRLCSFKETVLWLAAVIGSRLYFLCFGKFQITDAAGYFEAAMIREENTQKLCPSGLVSAYTGSLSALFRFAGNKIQAVPVFHTVLQIAAIMLLFWGCKLLFGRIAAYGTGAVLTASPWLIGSIFCISPENYYLFHFAFAFFLVGIFYQKLQRGLGFLLVTGFYIGVLSFWSGFGILLAASGLYALVKKQALQEKKLLRLFLQLFFAFAGAAAGAAASFTKFVPGCFQEPESLLFIWVAAAAFTGFVFQTVVKKREESRKETAEAEIGTEDRKTESGTEDRKTESGTEDGKTESRTEGRKTEIGTKDGKTEIGKENGTEDSKIERRKEDTETEDRTEEQPEQTETGTVKLIENPLPVPKKHVKRQMDFQFNEADDFDVDIKENDDFDF